MDWTTRINTPPFESARQGLLETVEAFQRWAAKQPRHAPHREWETLYEEWPALNTAFVRLLQASTPDQWDRSLVQALLYALARDDECEILKHDLLGSPTHLIALAKEGLTYDDYQARWQLADALGSPDLPTEQAEPLLERFVRDENEYVSRRALLALSRRHSPKTEAFAVRAWATGNAYQRMAALHALAECSSPMLLTYLELAKSSAFTHLKACAQDLCEKLERKGR